MLKRIGVTFLVLLSIWEAASVGAAAQTNLITQPHSFASLRFAVTDNSTDVMSAIRINALTQRGGIRESLADVAAVIPTLIPTLTKTIPDVDARTLFPQRLTALTAEGRINGYPMKPGNFSRSFEVMQF